MTGALEDQLLREVLAHEADRHEAPAFDPDAVVAGARARRRRGRAMVGGAALALTVVAASAVYAAQGLGSRDATSEIGPQGTRNTVPQERQTGAASAPLTRVTPGRNAAALSIPFCEHTVNTTHDVLHADGTAYRTDCAYARPHHRYLWYHASRTVMSSPDGLEVLVGDRLVKLSRLQSPGVRISMDGHYLAWFEEDALFVHDLVAGTPAGRFTMPDEILSAGVPSVEGVDWSGRSYVLVDDDFWMHDLGRDRWVAVSGLPAGASRHPHGFLAYLTRDGFALPVESIRAGDQLERSVEGRVTQGGAFEPVRTVPLGVAVWSTDRSHVVQLTREGFSAHPADDLDARELLAVPVDPADVPAVAWDAQWESGSTVLVTWAVTTGPAGYVTEDDFATYRCSATTGECHDLPREIGVPLSALAHPGG